MPFRYFDDDRLRQIRNAVIDGPGYDGRSRAAFAADIPPRFRSSLPDTSGLSAAAALMLELGRLNETERLTDGSIPLRAWLRNAVDLSGGGPSGELLAAALEELEGKASGAPSPDLDGTGLENEVIVHRDDMVPYAYMRQGLAAASAIAKLSVTRHADGAPVMTAQGFPAIYLGTSFLVGANLILTNHHVINARSKGEPVAAPADLEVQAHTAVAQFDFNSDDEEGERVKVTQLVACDELLDYALLRVASTNRVPLALGPEIAKTADADGNVALNIIQHPNGSAKKFAIRNNLLTAATQDEVRYFTDTAGGSSGSPVLNDLWQAVALHRGARRANNVKFNGKDVAYVNVGSQLTAIKRDLLQRYAGQVPELGI